MIPIRSFPRQLAVGQHVVDQCGGVDNQIHRVGQPPPGALAQAKIGHRLQISPAIGRAFLLVGPVVVVGVDVVAADELATGQPRLR